MHDSLLVAARRVANCMLLEGNIDAAEAIADGEKDFSFFYEVESLTHELSHAVTLGLNVINRRLGAHIAEILHGYAARDRHINEMSTLATEVNVLRAMGALPCRRAFLRTQLDVIRLRMRKTTLERRLMSRSYGCKARRDAARVVRIILHLDAQEQDPPWNIHDVI